MSGSSIEKTLNDFMVLSIEQNKQTEKKLSVLIKSIDNLTKCHIEAKKDREFDSARMLRFEKIQDTQTETLNTLSDTVLILNEHVNSQSGKWQKFGQFLLIVGAAAAASFITTFVSSNNTG